LGFLDIRDLVPVVLHVYDEQKNDGFMDLDQLVSIAVGHFSVMKVGTSVRELCMAHEFRPVKTTEKLSHIVHLLSSPTHHRIPVTNDSGHIVDIISQSSILQLLGERCIVIPDKEELDVSVDSINIGTSPVLTVSKDESVIETFRVLEANKRSGLALVDSDGRLVGTTTAKDLGLYLKSPNIAMLKIPIFQHLQKIRSQQDNIGTPCISIFPSDKLSRAIGLLVATKVHRIFVVDNEQNFRPIKVISITDILKYLDVVGK